MSVITQHGRRKLVLRWTVHRLSDDEASSRSWKEIMQWWHNDFMLQVCCHVYNFQIWKHKHPVKCQRVKILGYKTYIIVDIMVTVQTSSCFWCFFVCLSGMRGICETRFFFLPFPCKKKIWLFTALNKFFVSDEVKPVRSDEISWLT